MSGINGNGLKGIVPDKLRSFAKRETVFLISLLAALVSFLFTPPSAAMFRCIDYKVLSCLFCLMASVAGARKAGVLDVFASRLVRMSGSVRALGGILVFGTFFSSMAITNDVALITFVPLSLIVLSQVPDRRVRVTVIVLQTIAANMGSALTPIGNPQNLFLYSYYGVTLSRFLAETGIIVAASALLLACSLAFLPGIRLDRRTASNAFMIDGKRAIVYGILFLVTVFGVFGFLDYRPVLVIILAVVFVIDRRMLLSLDYGLLGTFVCFFIFIGNIQVIQALKDFLSGVVGGHPLVSGIVTSQVISNVPAAILLSGFTSSAGDLIRGVSIGGLGTIIASLASVISFKFYAHSYPEETFGYLAVFTAWNLVFMAVLFMVTVMAF